MTDITLLTAARQAFDRFAEGWITGNFEPYIALLADEMIFWFPMGTHRGKFEGVVGRQQMIAKCHDHTAVGDRLTLHAPQYVLSDGNSVMFEFEVEGNYAGQPYRGHNAIAFAMKGDQVIGFREYFGDLGQ
ncbi:MAG: nuclear transport factor 2 family protein [Cyanobacteria bacterium P01_H01_bin.162]